MNDKAKLIWATPDGDSLIAYMARVSNPDNQDNQESVGLIHYLIKHKHWSPFEMVSMCVEVSTTRDIGRQILRHRSFSFQEFSGRYQSFDKLPPVRMRQCRMQDTKNRQNSLEDVPEGVARWWDETQQGVHSVAYAAYQQALEAGIAKEQARALLPEGLTPSRMYIAGTLRSWIHYIDLRTDPSTQKEHRQIAEVCKALVAEQFPGVAAAVWRKPQS